MDETSKADGEKGPGLASTDLPGRRLVPSEKPRMLEPFEIDLLRQDLKAALARLRIAEADRVRRSIGLQCTAGDVVTISSHDAASHPVLVGESHLDELGSAAKLLHDTEAGQGLPADSFKLVGSGQITAGVEDPVAKIRADGQDRRGLVQCQMWVSKGKSGVRSFKVISNLLI